MNSNNMKSLQQISDELTQVSADLQVYTASVPTSVVPEVVPEVLPDTEAPVEAPVEPTPTE